MLPISLAASTHNQQIATAWLHVVGCALSGLIRELVSERSKMPRTLGPQGKHGYHRVIEPTHVGVTMKALAVVAIAILDDPKARKFDSIPALQHSCGIREYRVRQGLAATPARAESTLFDELLVAEQFGGLPGDIVQKVIEQDL